MNKQEIIKLLKVSFLTFVASFILSGAISYVLPNDNSSSLSGKLDSFIPTFLYLFVILYWLYFLVSWFFLYLCKYFKLPNIQRYLLGILLVFVVGYLAFNTPYIVTGEFDRVKIFVPFLLILFLVTGISLSFFTDKYFKKELTN